MEISLSNCVLCVRLYVSHADYFADGARNWANSDEGFDPTILANGWIPDKDNDQSKT